MNKPNVKLQIGRISMKNLETDIPKIKALSKGKENENWEFRSFLKECDITPEDIDEIVHELYEQISSEINCTTCGNYAELIGLAEDQYPKYAEYVTELRQEALN